MRAAKRELFIFDDIRPDASDKFCSPICRLEGLTFYTGNIYISGSIAAHNSLGTRNSLLMSWRFLRPLYRYLPILQSRFWFWQDTQLARGCNHLAGPPCVKKDLGRRHAFVSRTSTHVCARKVSLAIETSNWLLHETLFDRIMSQYLNVTENNNRRVLEIETSL